MSAGCFSVGYKPEQAPLLSDTPSFLLEGRTGIEDGWPQALPLWTWKCRASRAATSQQDVDIILSLTGPYRAPFSYNPTYNIKCWHGNQLLKNPRVIRTSVMCPWSMRAITNFQGFIHCSNCVWWRCRYTEQKHLCQYKMEDQVPTFFVYLNNITYSRIWTC